MTSARRMSKNTPHEPLDKIQLNQTFYLQFRDDNQPGTDLTIMPIWLSFSIFARLDDGYKTSEGISQFLRGEFDEVDFAVDKCKLVSRDQVTYPLPEQAVTEGDDDDDEFDEDGDEEDENEDEDDNEDEEKEQKPPKQK